MSKKMDFLFAENVEWADEIAGPPEGWDGVMPYAVRTGKCQAMGMELECAVLNDGRRVFSGPVIEEMIQASKEMR
jgi:hypothetical protein